VAAGLVALAPGARLDSALTLAPEAKVLFAVVDGMGGQAGGEAAAGVVATELARLDPTSVEDWTPVLEAISDRVGQAGQAWAAPDMGATVALLVVGRDQAVVANVGDSRCHQVADGYVSQISVDDRDTLAGDNVVTQSLGGDPRALDAHQFAVPHSDGPSTRYLLCSDGLHGVVPHDVLRSVLVEPRPPKDVVALLDGLARLSATDNYSILVVDVVRSAADGPSSAHREGG
jgi:serine/threonine protein phosphatase PrpC